PPLLCLHTLSLHDALPISFAVLFSPGVPMRFSPLLAALALVVAAPLAHADAEQAIRKTLNTLQSDLKVESVGESPVKGLYQVQLDRKSTRLNSSHVKISYA